MPETKFNTKSCSKYALTPPYQYQFDNYWWTIMNKKKRCSFYPDYIPPCFKDSLSLLFLGRIGCINIESNFNTKSCLKYVLAPEQFQQWLRNDYILPINKMQKWLNCNKYILPECKLFLCLSFLGKNEWVIKISITHSVSNFLLHQTCFNLY